MGSSSPNIVSSRVWYKITPHLRACWDYKSRIRKSKSCKVIYKIKGLLHPLSIGFGGLDALNSNTLKLFLMGFKPASSLPLSPLKRLAFLNSPMVIWNTPFLIIRRNSAPHVFLRYVCSKSPFWFLAGIFLDAFVFCISLRFYTLDNWNLF